MEQNLLTLQGHVIERENRVNIDKRAYFVAKRAFDILVSLVSLLVLLPLMIVLTLLIISVDRIPPFYAMDRIGKGGQIIKIFKFRTMVKDADNLHKYFTKDELEKYYLNYKLENDKRITRLGKFLRKTSLDELPQFINILMGTMSFVGPRPIVEKEKSKYGDDFPLLVSVKPGLTGYWQAYGRNRISYDNGQRQKMELKYVETCNLVLDVKIIFKTFSAVLKCDGAY